MTSLQAGSKLGPYEILAPIGAGGMGEVWKARDTRLGRIVAIKKVREQYAAIRSFRCECGHGSSSVFVCWKEEQIIYR